MRPAEQSLDMTDFYDDEYELEDDDDEDEEEEDQLSGSDSENGDDSGNGESWSITRIYNPGTHDNAPLSTSSL